MRRNLTTIAVTTGTALAVVGAALVTAPAADAAAHRGTTTMHAGKKHTVSIAKTLRPGVVHFKNSGSAAIIVIREKKKKDGAAELVKLGNKPSQKANREFAKKFDVVELALPKSDTWTKLKKGTYFFLDANVDKLKTKNVRTVVVKGKTSNAKVPRAKQLTFSAKGTIPGWTTITHKSAIRVVNHSSQPAVGVLLPIIASATYTQLKQVVAHPTDEGIANLIDEDNESDDFQLLPVFAGPKHTVTGTTKLGKGRYLVMTGAEKVRTGTVGLLTVK